LEASVEVRILSRQQGEAWTEILWATKAPRHKEE
jgi:hypothetical protein